MRKLLMLGVLMAASMLFAAQAQAIAVVDHFEQGLFHLYVDNGVQGPELPHQTFDSDNQVGLTQVMGGRRYAELRHVSGGGSTRAATGDIPNVLPDHYLDYSNTASFESVLTLYYGKLPGALSLGTDVALGDLTLGGQNNVVAVKYLWSDLGATTKILLVDNMANSYEVAIATLSGPSYLLFNLGTYQANGVDVTNIDYMRITFEGKPAGDYTIDSVELGFVPEPLTMVGVAMGIGGLARYTRKRRG